MSQCDASENLGHSAATTFVLAAMMSSSDPTSATFSGSGADPSPIQNITAQYSKIQRQYQQILDRWTPHMLYRWLASAGLLAVFFLRIVLAQGVSSSTSYCHYILTIL